MPLPNEVITSRKKKKVSVIAGDEAPRNQIASAISKKGSRSTSPPIHITNGFL